MNPFNALLPLLFVAAVSNSTAQPQAIAAKQSPKIIQNNEELPPLHRFLSIHRVTPADFQAILAAGNDINVRDSEGNTLLHKPELLNNINLPLAELIAAGADINARNHQGITPLMIHAGIDKQRFFVQLLEAGADVHAHDKNGKTAADYAAERYCAYNYIRLSMVAKGKAETSHVTGLLHTLARTANRCYNPAQQKEYISKLEELLAAGADVNIPDWNGTSYIFHALHWYRDCRPLELALKYGGDINTRNGEGNTLLHLSAGNSTRLLLNAGADPNAVNTVGNPVITQVIANFRTRGEDDVSNADVTVELLLEAGANPNAADTEGNTAMHHLIQGMDCGNIIRKLAATGADINARNKAGATPLMLGAAYGWSKTLCVLLKLKPELNCRDNRGLTAMHYAALNGHTPSTIREAGASTGNALEDAIMLNNSQEVQQLIDNGANVNAAGAHDYAPLHWAAACGNADIVRMLLAAGAKPDVQNNDGHTPLQLCFISPFHINSECVALLLEAGSNPNVKARDNDELLIFAAARNAAVLEHMLRKGISPDIKDSEGTPLIFHATSYRYAPDTPVKVLLNAGVDIFAKNAEGKDVFEADLIMEYEIFKALDEARQKRTPEDERQ